MSGGEDQDGELSNTRERLSRNTSMAARCVAALLAGLFFALLALGNAVDFDALRNSASRTIGPRIVGESNLRMIDLARARADRYGVYLALYEHAAGSSLTIHPDVQGLSPLYLYGLAGMARVETRELEAPAMTRQQSAVASGGFRELRWELRAPASGTAALYAHPDGEKVVISSLDGSVSEQPSSTTGGSSETATRRSVLRDGLTDAVIAALLALFGTAALGGRHLPTVSKPALGLLVGLSALAAAGLLRLGGLGGLAVAVALLAGLGFITRHRRQRRPTARGVAVAALTGMTLAVATTFSRALGLVSTSPDSFRYLAGGSAMSAGQLGLDSLSAKHMIAQQSLHAPLFSLGVEGFQSLGPVVFIAGLVLVFQFSRDVTSDLGFWAQRTLPIAVTVALATSPALWRMAIYVNAHMLFGVLLLSFAYIYYRRPAQRVEDSAAQNSAGLLLVALTLLRPEGLLVVGLLFVACATRGASGSEVWKRPWIMAALAGISWNVLVLVGGGIQLAPVISLGLAVLLLIAAAGLTRPPRQFLVAVRRVTAAGLWSITAIIFFQATEDITFFAAIRANILEGAGGWGQLGAFFAVAIIVIHVWALFGMFKAGDAAVSWSVTLFLPIILLVKLGDGAQAADVSIGALASLLGQGGGRVAWADSVNRMWMHIALLVPVAMLLGLNELARRAAVYAERSIIKGAILGASGLGLVALLLLWEPTYATSRWVRFAPWIGAALLMISSTVALMRLPTRLKQRLNSSLANPQSGPPMSRAAQQ